MWYKEELNNIRKLYDGIDHVKLYHFLSDDELDIIDEKEVRFGNLRNRCILPGPKTMYKYSTVTFQRLYTEDLDFDEWLAIIAEKVVWAEKTNVQIGFSFFGELKYLKYSQYFSLETHHRRNNIRLGWSLFVTLFFSNQFSS